MACELVDKRRAGRWRPIVARASYWAIILVRRALDQLATNVVCCARRGCGLAFRVGMTTCRPRLYVHKLPESYRDPLDRVGRGVGSAVDGSPSSSLAGFPVGVRLWDSQQYQLGQHFYERALGYRCRTHHAAAADLFLVPAFSARPWLHLKGEPAAERGHHSADGRGQLLGRLRDARSVDACTGEPTDALRARGGVDHIILSAGDGLDWQVKPLAELDMLDQAFGAAMLLSVGEYQRAWDAQPWMGAAKPLERFRSIPYPSMVHVDSEAKALPWAWDRARTRAQPLVSAVFLTDHGSVEVAGLRKAIVRSCEAHPRHCRYTPPEPKGGGIGDQVLEEPLPLRMAA